MTNNVYITAYSSITALGVNNSETIKNLRQHKINIYHPGKQDIFKKPYFLVDQIQSDKNKNTKCAAMALALMENMSGELADYQDLPLFLATSTGGIKETEEIYLELVKYNHKYPMKEKEYFYDISSILQRKYPELIGEVYSLFTSACSSAGHALFQAVRFIQQGVMDKALILAVDALSITTLTGFDALKLISQEGTRPLTLERDGISLGDGGAAVLLEANPAKKAHAEICSVYSNTDGYHITSPNPAGTQQQECILKILEQANVDPQQVDYINAHGTGTPLNDEIEVKVLKNIFKNVHISSLKGFIGHTVGSSALTELCITLQMLNEEKIYIPPFAATSMDPEIIPITTLNKKVNYFIKNSFGFGGNNVSMLVKNLNEKKD
ncbi:MAG: hypothetical protein MJB14_09255 [Spirochaetes bacterium]|nr:hypothetical protein [Spirochaetota bacterium]